MNGPIKARAGTQGSTWGRTMVIAPASRFACKNIENGSKRIWLDGKHKYRGQNWQLRTFAAVYSTSGEEEFEQESLTKKIRAIVSDRIELVNEDSAGISSTVQLGSGVDKNLELADGQERLQRAVSALEEGLVERGAEARLLVLAACCGEHLLLIGPPGTAKSEVARRLGVLCNGQFFQRILTRFSVPEELFGPLSLSALEQDIYQRNTEGYLPHAEVAFVDEVFKANSAVLNSLLMILNERKFDNGSKQVKVPLICLVGASNELPEDPELQALYDRFLFRRQVEPISDQGIYNLLSSSSSKSNLENGSYSISSEWLSSVKEKALSSVEVPSKVIDMLTRLRRHLMETCEPPIYISDRRLLKCLHMLMVVAYTNGRSVVSEFDCILLQHVCWSKPQEQEKVNEWIVDQLLSGSEVSQMKYLLLGVFTRACKVMHRKEEEKGGDDPAGYEDICSDLNSFKELLFDKLAQMSHQKNILEDLIHHNIWICAEEANELAGRLKRPLESSYGKVKGLLEDTLVLESSMEESVPVYILADLLPEYWADFIRKGDIEDVKPIGIRPLSA